MIPETVRGTSRPHAYRNGAASGPSSSAASTASAASARQWIGCTSRVESVVIGFYSLSGHFAPELCANGADRGANLPAKNTYSAAGADAPIIAQHSTMRQRHTGRQLPRPNVG